MQPVTVAQHINPLCHPETVDVNFTEIHFRIVKSSIKSQNVAKEEKSKDHQYNVIGLKGRRKTNDLRPVSKSEHVGLIHRSTGI